MDNLNETEFDPVQALEARVGALEEALTNMAAKGGAAPSISVPETFGEDLATAIRYRHFSTAGKLIQGIFSKPASTEVGAEVQEDAA